MTENDLDQESQERLVSRYGRSFVPGELLFSDGDPGTEAYLLQEGRIRLIKRVGAAERSLRLLRPGDLFGESALVVGAARSSTAVASTAGSVLVIDQRTLEQILSAYPAVGMRVMQQLVRRLRDAEDQIEVLMLEDSRSKIVVTLLKLAQQAQVPVASIDPVAVELSVSPMDLSTRVGLDLETVKRTVQQLKESGHLQITGERIEIPNVASLRELSNLLALRDHIVGMPRERANRRIRPDS
jgi:CRP/FNR family transcriptional regulator, cyclic AMP receptor protein